MDHLVQADLLGLQVLEGHLVRQVRLGQAEQADLLVRLDHLVLADHLGLPVLVGHLESMDQAELLDHLVLEGHPVRQVLLDQAELAVVQVLPELMGLLELQE